MIISHKYRFIFLKTAKTAGTSIEIALSKFLGDDDIITPVSSDDENIRRQLDYRGPQNFRRTPGKRRVSSFFSTMFGRRQKAFYNHMPAHEVRDLIGDEIWNGYYKFCFERNPFDRVVSLYYWCHKTEPRPTMAEFLKHKEIQLLSTRGISLYTFDGEQPVVDKIGRYETLTHDLDEIRQRLGIPEPLVLPQAKTSHRTDRRHYSEILDDECRDEIAARFHREMQLFDYRF